MPSCDFFVYRVHKNDGIQELTDFLNNNEVTVRKLIIKNHDETIPLCCQCLPVMQAKSMILTSGIYVRRWRDDQQRRNLQQLAESTDGNNKNTDVGDTNE